MTSNPNEARLRRFSQAIGFSTVSWPRDEEVDTAGLLAFQAFLGRSFPALHQQAEVNSTGPYGLWFRIPARTGTPGSRKPVLFLAHYDVVPVDQASWSFDAFGGEVQTDQGQTWICGRGTLDTKNTLMALCEALESACAAGWHFDRDIYAAFGGDEEKNGTRGAMAMAAEFRRRGLEFEWVLDEGAVVTEGMVSGLKLPVATIGLAEKGYANIEILVDQEPGHSSRPPSRQAGAVLGRALARLERPFAPRLLPSVARFFQGLGRESRGLQALVMGHPGFFWPLLKAAVLGNPDIASMLRTTLAITQLEGSAAANVLPHRVKAVCNLRILPGQTVESALAQVRRRLSGLKGVTVQLDASCLASDPVAESHMEGPGWSLVEEGIRQVFGQCLVLPYLCTAQTDSRHYVDLTRNTYRFAPMKLDRDALNRIHGHDERISVENYLSGIAFYQTLLARLAGGN